MSQQNSRKVFSFLNNQPAQVWLSVVFLLVILVVALAAYITAPILAVKWFEQPFLGGYIEQTLVFNSGVSNGADESFVSSGLYESFGNQLVALDGKAVTSTKVFNDALIEHQAGDIVKVTVRSAEGALKDYSIRLVAYPSADRIAQFFLPYVVGAIYLVAAIWIFIIRRQEPEARPFIAFSVSVALAAGCLFDLSTTHRLGWLWILAIAFAGAALLNLSLSFPATVQIYRKQPWLRFLPYGLGLLLAVFSWFAMINMQSPSAYGWTWRAVYVFTGLCAVTALIRLIWRGQRTTSPVEREQVLIIAIGGVVSFAPVALWMLASPVIQSRWDFSSYLLLPFLVFPAVMVYVNQRYRALQADTIISRVVLYGVLAVLIMGGYALIVSGLSLLLGQFFKENSLILSGLVFFLLALAILPLRNTIARNVDAVFFRGERAYDDRLDSFNSELTETVDLNGIVKKLREVIVGSMQPEQLHIFLMDALSEQYIAAVDEQNQSTTDLHFSASNPLVQTIGAQKQGPLFFSNLQDLPQQLQVERSRIQLLGAQMFVQLPGRQRLSGWIALGQKRSGEPYTGYDIKFLESLADQSALAIERAQVVENMQRRVREMNVLTRVAQGTNITITLDDIYELVYAQSTQVIESDDVRLMLLDPDTDSLRQVFFIQGDDRLSDQENITILPGTALEHEVIRSRRAILTDDYNRECQKRGILSNNPDIFAWMCVPLNAGAGTIGAYSLASRVPAVAYTNDQVNLLQAIADQVAGAIVKTRLLDETERRARQLTTLNEVTRQLTSTLELEPLLQNILHNAVNILNCEAGSLILVDEQTGELVFRVTEGPVAQDLINKRMPAGSGVVGISVRNREPVVVNDVLASPDWFSSNDEQTGFVTRAILVVPLVFKETVTGVIEVINRKDGRPFSQEDQGLLMAFAAQAAIAIENARLYTLTDRALADRVEELSVMQRIDRELNTSLDTTRTMRITLEWAMRQSGANAGWVGMLHEAGIQVISSQGYAEELAPYQDDYLPLEKYALQDVVTSGQPVCRSINPDVPALLANGRSQILLPIRREEETSGLIYLESSSLENVPQDVLDFLVRLCDHASIAISNAQLYAAVQAANIAKSEFVSFVAHELKNPMTSIKGYTELLAAGAVGPISETQANFLGTIRSNVDRMKTIVEDLNDLSKIEAGRLKLDYKSAALKEMVEDVIRSLRKQIEDKEQKLNILIPADLPGMWCDRNRVLQVLVNLVSNAHKYTERGGDIYVNAEKCQNVWDPQGVPEVVHIWVQDTGIGISPEDQKKIFSKFFRSEDPKTREVPGTGLGLNITRSLVEMQGGKIWFESEFRKGTIFHFTVPVAG